MMKEFLKKETHIIVCIGFYSDRHNLFCPGGFG